MAASDQQILNLILATECYHNLDAVEKSKVAKAMLGQPSASPRSNIAKAAYQLARRLHPLPITPPEPPKPTRRFMAPQTYNKGSRGQDAQYCTTGLPRNDAGQPFEPSSPGITYNEGLCNGGRTGDAVAGLKPADEMDDRGPCDPYSKDGVSFPPWPEASYAS